jgi:hypothetical protein
MNMSSRPSGDAKRLTGDSTVLPYTIPVSISRLKSSGPRSRVILTEYSKYQLVELFSKPAVKLYGKQEFN